MNKKVSFFLPTLNFGGIEANTIRLANAFSKKGYDVDLLVARAEGDYIDRIPEYIKVVNFHKNKVYTTIPQLIKYIRRVKPEAIIAGGEAPNIVLILSKLLSFQSQTKTIVSIRTHLSTELKHTKNLNKRILAILGKLLYRCADEIVAVSRGVAEDVSVLFAIKLEKISVVYNPIVDDKLKNISNEIYKGKIEVNTIPVILGVGRLAHVKNFSLLIEAFSNVVEQTEAKLIIVGEGPERGKLEKKVFDLGLNNRVELVGYKPNPYLLMESSDVFVLSSLWEGFGNVLVEAMACGMKVVSTNCNGGPTEILDGGRFGELVENDNADALTKGILNALNNRYDVKKNIVRSKDFTVEKAMESYIKLIKTK